MKRKTRREFLRTGTGAIALAGVSGCRHRLPPTAALHVPAGMRRPEGARSTIRFRLNGKEQEYEVDARDSALDTIRVQAGLTGAKPGCGQGVCGGCTVLVYGKPVASCLLPATSLHGKDVLTIEGLPADLHPIQRAFIARDALQCGFCTPGFVMGAVAFFERWRADRGAAEPSREEAARALAGNLCRCGAYEGILSAVRDACAGRFDLPASAAAPRRDAHEKVTGRAAYTADVSYPGMLEGRILRSPYAHALVKAIDLHGFGDLDGVKAVLRLIGEDGLVRYAGQEILAVACVDRRTAEEALARIRIDYEVKPATLTIAEARRPGSEPVYASRKRYAPMTGEGPKVPSIKWRGNVRGPFFFFSKHHLKVSKALARSKDGGAVVEGTWRTSAQVHSAMEPHGCVALWDGDDLTVHLSTQAVDRLRGDIAERWHLPESRVRVLAHHVGGAFGAKAILSPEIVAAVDLARAAGAPVRLMLDRREELCVAGSRPETEIGLAIGVTKDGEFGGMRVRAYGNAGVAVGNAVTPLLRVHYSHRHSPRDLKEWDVVTHASPGAPFRGPGGPPAFFAIEQAVDELAARRGEDPIDFRERWDRNPPRLWLYEWARSLPVWQRRASSAASDRGRFRRGIGLATGSWFHFPQVDTEVEVGIDQGGILYAASATQDTGNGTRSVMAGAVAKVFSIPQDKVDVRIGDSRHVTGPMSAGSRTTASLAPTCELAARALRDDLCAEASRGTLKDARAVDGGIAHAGGLLPWHQVLATASARRVVMKRPRQEKHFLPFAVNAGGKVQVGRHLTGAVQIAEVEVDVRLGRIRVLEVWGGYGCGRIQLPDLARSQAAGGVVQGIGYALYEERRLDPRQGLVLTVSLDDYHIPGIGDSPVIHTHFHEEGFETALHRIVGVAELCTLPTAAAIANALAHATGFRPKELPLRVDRVLGGMRA